MHIDWFGDTYPLFQRDEFFFDYTSFVMSTEGM